MLGLSLTCFNQFIAKYCDEYVCLWVCLPVREDICGTTRAIFTYQRGVGRMTICLTILIEHRLLIDGRTDGYRVARASRGKK